MIVVERDHIQCSEEMQFTTKSTELKRNLALSAYSSESFKSHVKQHLFALVVALSLLLMFTSSTQPASANVLMKVCDTREIKTITSRVCMLYKRTKHSDVRMDKQGNIRITRGAKGDYSPAKLANECCKIGCPPHIFALNC